MADYEELRRLIIERERSLQPPATSDDERALARLCMWTSPDEFTIIPPGEDE